MLSSWSAEGLSVPFLATENFTLTIGQAIYTIGSAGDFNTTRPLRIVNAFIRVSNNDHPVDVNMTKDEYTILLSKDIEGRPYELYYDPQYPLGKIKFNYEADTAYDFHLVSEKELINPTALGTTFSIPLMANRAMVFNLAIEIASDEDNQLPKEVFRIAAESKQILEDYNAIDRLTGPAVFDRAVTYNNYRRMDINAGE